MSDLTPAQRAALFEKLPEAKQKELVAMFVQQHWTAEEIGRQLDPRRGNPSLMCGADGKIRSEIRKLYPGREYKAWFDHHDHEMVKAELARLKMILAGWKRRASHLEDILDKHDLDYDMVDEVDEDDE